MNQHLGIIFAFVVCSAMQTCLVLAQDTDPSQKQNPPTMPSDETAKPDAKIQNVGQKGKAGDASWGEVNDGLQLGLCISEDKVKEIDVTYLTILLKNKTDTEKSFLLSHPMSNFRYEVRTIDNDENVGDKIAVSVSTPLRVSGTHQILSPGDTLSIKAQTKMLFSGSLVAGQRYRLSVCTGTFSPEKSAGTGAGVASKMISASIDFTFKAENPPPEAPIWRSQIDKSPQPVQNAKNGTAKQESQVAKTEPESFPWREGSKF